jgi:hypothetical protein
MNLFLIFQEIIIDFFSNFELFHIILKRHSTMYPILVMLTIKKKSLNNTYESLRINLS